MYKQNYFIADGSVESLVITSTPDAQAQCHGVLLAADSKILWAGLAAPEHLDNHVTQIGLQGVFPHDGFQVSEVIAIDDSPEPQSATVSSQQSAPANASEPAPAAADRALVRGAWLWSPDLWAEQQAFIWQTQSEQKLSEIYISVEVENGSVSNARQLAQFIKSAGERSLKVWVVAGDPHDVLPGSQAAVEQRMMALLNYQNSVAPASQLAGIQLDIEPYLLNGFARSQTLWRQRYVTIIQHIHQVLGGQMMMDIVMPAWWGRHASWGNPFLAELPVVNTRISIMNYHTATERLLHNAEPFLQWGRQNAVPVQIALESGYLRDENHRRYRAHETAGELWLLETGEQAIFVLFEQPQSNLDGKAFAFAFEYAVPASTYTFAGDMARLSQSVAELETEWRSFSSFSGISIHGLDDSRYRDIQR